jgi:hypothetical protein
MSSVLPRKSPSQNLGQTITLASKSLPIYYSSIILTFEAIHKHSPVSWEHSEITIPSPFTKQLPAYEIQITPDTAVSNILQYQQSWLHTFQILYRAVTRELQVAGRTAGAFTQFGLLHIQSVCLQMCRVAANITNKQSCTADRGWYSSSGVKTASDFDSLDKRPRRTPWSESASELYRPSYRRLSAKWLPTFADKRCHVVSVTDPYGRILGFLDRSRYFSIK